MAVRTDLNGMLVTNPDNTEPWYLIDRGVRRGIPPAAFSRFLDDVGQLQTPPSQGNIDRGEDWPVDVALIGSTEISTIWVLENGKKRGITSGQVMDYYHFARSQVSLKTPAELDAIPDGPFIEPPTTPQSGDPVIKVPAPIVKSASGARGKAKVTVRPDGTVELYMKVWISAGTPNDVRYIATTLISGWHDHDPFVSLSPGSLPVHTLTIGSHPVWDTDKSKTWPLYSVAPADLQRIRDVHVYLERDDGQDLAGIVIDTLRRAGEVWDEADTLYKKVKHSELGEDIVKLVAAS